MKEKLLILFIALANCGFGQVLISIPEPFGNNLIESDLIQQVTIVPLKLEKPDSITADMEMKCDAENYFILNNQLNIVYRFNKDGELVNRIYDIKPEATNANSPVLNNPVKFSINKNKKQVEIYNFESSRITTYDYNGNALGKTPLEINPSDFVQDALGNFWIYTGWNNKDTQFRLLKVDRNGKTLDKKMRLISKCMPTEGFSFFTSKEGIFLWEILGNTTYLIAGNDITPTYTFDFGPRNLSPNYHLLDPYDAFKEINETGYFSMKKYLENESFAYFFLNFINVNQKEIFHVIYDKKAQRSYVYTENSSIAAFDKAQYITSDNELVFLVLPRKMRQLLKSGSEFVPSAFINIEQEIKELKYPVILKIKLVSPS